MPMERARGVGWGGVGGGGWGAVGQTRTRTRSEGRDGKELDRCVCATMMLCFALLSSHFQVKPTHSLHTVL